MDGVTDELAKHFTVYNFDRPGRGPTVGDGLVPAELAATVKVQTLIFSAKATPVAAQTLVDAMPTARFDAIGTATYESLPADVAERLRRWAA